MMNSRKIYLILMSALQFGVGAFFALRESMPPASALILSAVVAILLAGVLSASSDRLASRAVRAFVGLALVFGAIWFGVLHEMFALAVLWAGILFGTLDALGKMSSADGMTAETGGALS